MRQISKIKNAGFRIIAVGDIFPADHYFMIGHGHGTVIHNGSLRAPMSILSAIISNNDIVIGNMEAPLCETTRYQVSYAKKTFRGHPQFAKELNSAGFNLINIANNHIMQHGSIAFDETIAAISNEGISILGLAGSDSYYSKPVYMTRDGLSVCILGYSIVDDPYCESPRPYAHASPDQICKDVSRAARQSDVLVVSIHGGLEGSPLPDRSQRDLFRKVAQTGADIVIGHHSHVVQPVEKRDGSVIVYSLGNFIFDLPWFPEAIDGAIAKIPISKSGMIENVKIVGTRINESLAVRNMDDHEFHIFSERLLHYCQSLSLDNDEYDAAVERVNKLIQGPLRRAKLIYFFRNLAKGDTLAKIRFLIDKLAMRL